ncbi:MAG: DoxX family protein [Planctomycetota bacterium]
MAVGGLMLPHGIAKIRHGIQAIRDMLLQSGLPESMAPLVFVGEVVAPILILLGFLTRPMALILAITMLFSIYLAYGTELFGLNQYGGLVTEVNFLFLAGSLALFFGGGGRYAVGGGEGRWN